MSYDIQRKKATREKFYLVEVYLPYCENEYGVAPCTASGSEKCFNTFASCQDRANFTTGEKIYRFCSARSPMPVGIPAFTMPTVTGVTFTAPSIDVEGGLGVRASVAVNFADAPSADIGIDKYRNERTYAPHKQGTYWGKLRARNPYYEDKKVIVYSGFLNDDGTYDQDNMQQRVYIISGLVVGNGTAKLDARDPLKLAEGIKAQYPVKSTGAVVGDLTESTTTFTISPLDIGDEEYPSSGFIRMSEEVMSFTRSGNTFTVIRGQYNTSAETHDSGDAVQLCAYMNGRVDTILTELLTVGASVPAEYINAADWSSEASTNYPVSIERLITEPEDVEDLIKEVCETCPSYIYWDERNTEIRFEAVKAPPVDLDTLNDFANMKGTFTYADQLKMRASRIIVYLGQIDPTKKEDETSNYAQTYVRADFEAESAAGSPAIRTIYSRWLTKFNKASAVLLATRLGRRFAQAPRLVNFTLTSKDIEYWLGSACNVSTPELQNFDGSQSTMPAQIVSVAEKSSGYVYSGLEFYWGEELPGDAEDGVNLVIIGGDSSSINLRTIYDTLYPTPTDDTVPKFVIDVSVEVGAGVSGTYAIDTGTWPGGMEPLEVYIRGFVQGRGGKGADAENQFTGSDGSDALIMNHDVIIKEVSGRLAGGGGGGARGEDNESGTKAAAGGGGAGIPAGAGGALYIGGAQGQDGTKDYGGDAGEYDLAFGGDGGNPGMDGNVGSSLAAQQYYAGAAVIKNGYTLTIEDGEDNIFGAII